MVETLGRPAGFCLHLSMSGKPAGYNAPRFPVDGVVENWWLWEGGCMLCGLYATPAHLQSERHKKHVEMATKLGAHLKSPFQCPWYACDDEGWMYCRLCKKSAIRDHHVSKHHYDTVTRGWKTLVKCCPEAFDELPVEFPRALGEGELPALKIE